VLLHSNTVANTDDFAANRSTCMLHTADESKLCLHKCKAMQSIGRGSKAVSTYKCCSNYAAFEVRARHFEASVEAVKLHEHADSHNESANAQKTADCNSKQAQRVPKMTSLTCIILDLYFLFHVFIFFHVFFKATAIRAGSCRGHLSCCWCCLCSCPSNCRGSCSCSCICTCLRACFSSWDKTASKYHGKRVCAVCWWGS